MSLMNLAGEFKKLVMCEFLKHCDGSPANVDPTMLSMLVSSYMGEEVEFPKMEKKKRGPKPKSPKAKKSEGDMKFERMPEVVDGKCMARSFAGGLGTQCTRKHSSGSEYCKTHQKSVNDEGIPKFGRIDLPRMRCCQDNSGECGWKYFNGDGDVEEVTVCPVIERSDSEATDIMEGGDEKVVEEVCQVIEGSDSDADKVEEVMKDLVTSVVVESSIKDAVPTVEEAPKVEEEAPKVEEEEPKVEEPKVEEPKVENTLMNEPVEVPYNPNAVEESPKEEEEPNTMDEEASEKVGLIQGVQYLFKKSEENDGEYDIYRMDKDCKIVGGYDGDDYVFMEEYQEIHDFKITDDDQDEIEWV